MSDKLQAILAKKKGSVLVLLQNISNETLVFKSSNLGKGKIEKSFPIPNSILPTSLSEFGVIKPNGYLEWNVESDPSQILHVVLKAEDQNAFVEHFPEKSIIKSEIEQNWTKKLPQVIVTLSSSEIMVEQKNLKEPKDSKETKETKELKDSKESKELKDSKDSKEPKDSKDSKELKELNDPKESKELKDPKESKTYVLIFNFINFQKKW